MGRAQARSSEQALGSHPSQLFLPDHDSYATSLAHHPNTRWRVTSFLPLVAEKIPNKKMSKMGCVYRSRPFDMKTGCV